MLWVICKYHVSQETYTVHCVVNTVGCVLCIDYVTLLINVYCGTNYLFVVRSLRSRYVYVHTTTMIEVYAQNTELVNSSVLKAETLTRITLVIERRPKWGCGEE